MVAIVDYGVGNLFSLRSSLEYIGEKVIVTGDAEEMRRCDRIILPGVGAFGDAAEKLRKSGLDEIVKAEAAAGRPLLGICLGMQLLFEKSYEYGEHDGLGLIAGSVRPIAPMIGEGLKVPHIGWNDLAFPGEGRLFAGIPQGSYVYFVHSYYLQAADESIVTATTQYGVTIHASVEKENLFACQFHPEKSSESGLRILRNFVSISTQNKK